MAKSQKTPTDWQAPTSGTPAGSSGDAFARYQQACPDHYDKECCYPTMSSPEDWQKHYKDRNDLLDLMSRGGMVLEFDKK